jgi:hypothetical protein
LWRHARRGWHFLLWNVLAQSLTTVTTVRAVVRTPRDSFFYHIVQSVHGHLEVVQELMKAGADIKATTEVLGIHASTQLIYVALG